MFKLFEHGSPGDMPQGSEEKKQLKEAARLVREAKRLLRAQKRVEKYVRVFTKLLLLRELKNLSGKVSLTDAQILARLKEVAEQGLKS